MFGFTSGCFDLLHPLHILYLEKCRALCDCLYVGIDSDVNILKNKGKTPIFNQKDRSYMVKSLTVVDETFIVNNTDEYYSYLYSFNQHVRHFKNSSTVYNTPVLSNPKIELIIIPDIKQFSSTIEIKQYLNENNLKTIGL